MDDKIKILLDRINIDKENYQYFSDSKITKIKINSKNDAWNIFIEKENLLPVEVLEELFTKKYLLDEKAYSIDFIFDIKNKDIDTYQSYYKYLLSTLKNDLKVLEIYEDDLKIENEKLCLIVGNLYEQERLEKVLDKINSFYHKLGYIEDINIIVREEEGLLEEIQNELENIEIPVKAPKEVKKDSPSKEKTYHKEAKDPNSILGRGIKDEPIKIKALRRR